jgi:hypothetical protein
LKDHTTSNGVHFQYCYHVVYVPNRTGILIHPGNTLFDTHGCILVGEPPPEKATILINSRHAILKILEAVDGRDFDLEVINP